MQKLWSRLLAVVSENQGRKIVTAAFLIVAATQPLDAVVTLYAQTTATQSTSSFPGTPIDGLTLTLPAAAAEYNAAIVTLDMPNLRLSMPSSPKQRLSADIELVAPFAPSGLISVLGGIGCDTLGITASGFKPVTMVLEVPLGSTTQLVEAEWDSKNGTVSTERFASISAILVRR